MLSPRQYAGWAAYYAREPWGFRAADFRFGLLTATVAQAAGAKTPMSDFTLSSVLERAVEEEEDPFDKFDRVVQGK